MLAWALWLTGWLALAYASCVVATLQAHWPFPEPEHRAYARECVWMALGATAVGLALLFRADAIAAALRRLLPG